MYQPNEFPKRRYELNKNVWSRATLFFKWDGWWLELEDRDLDAHASFRIATLETEFDDPFPATDLDATSMDRVTAGGVSICFRTVLPLPTDDLWWKVARRDLMRLRDGTVDGVFTLFRD